MRRVLMVAYQYPPCGGSSAVQRALRFSSDLRRYGWEPVVLTARERAYPVTDRTLVDAIPPGVPVERAFALDAARHLAVRGRYPRIAALPDRWASWVVGAVPAGWRLVRKWRPSVIWSTYPLATTHAIGWALQRLSGLPWVSDFRDSMTEEGYPRDALTRAVYRCIEERTVAESARVVFTAPGALRMYRARYPDVPGDRWRVVRNGYDEAVFHGLEEAGSLQPAGPRALKLVHSGVLYPEERDPSAFFRALAELRAEGHLGPQRVRVVLRAPGNEQGYRGALSRIGIGDIVLLEPRLSYGDAVREMLQADGLLLFQGASCNHQIPAKAYEYIRARRPVLTLADPEGDTATLLRDAGLDAIARLDSTEEIKEVFLRFVEGIEQGTASLPEDGAVERHSRARRAGELAEILNELV